MAQNDCLSKFSCGIRDDGSNCWQCKSPMGITLTESIKMAEVKGIITSGDMYEDYEEPDYSYD